MKTNTYELILRKLSDKQREIILMRKAGFSYPEIIDILKKNAIQLTINEIKELIINTATYIHSKEPTLIPKQAENLELQLSEKERYYFEIIEAFIHALPVITAPESLKKRIDDIFKTK